MAKIELGLPKPAQTEKKVSDVKLPEKVAKKYEALITPTKLRFPSGVEIDMRTMSVEEADAIHEFRPGQYLKLIEKKPADDSKAAKP